jgi:N-acetylglucosaminyldiphosphoundecaprenol N-acetyl-beta-D-mannosaminyltransferase
MSAASLGRTALRNVALETRIPRVRVGRVWIDAVGFQGALDRIAALVDTGRGGSVFTPNVDHIVMAEEDQRFRDAYERASLVLVDGMPVLWASRLLRTPLVEKVSGSDLIVPLAELAAASGWRVYLLGGGPGSAAASAARFRSEFGVNVVGHDDPIVASDGAAENEVAVLSRIRRARPDLVLVGLGAPKQEFFIERAQEWLGYAVAVAIGAGLDFVAGNIRRAPRWMCASGLEWLYRLAQEPRRLWRRYLVRDPRFLLVVARTLLEPRRARMRDQLVSRIEREQHPQPSTLERAVALGRVPFADRPRRSPDTAAVERHRDAPYPVAPGEETPARSRRTSGDFEGANT